MGAGRRTAVLGVAMVMAGLLVTAGCAGGSRHDAAQWQEKPVAATASAPPVVGETSAPPASPSPAPSSASPSATVKPKPTLKKPAPVQPSKDPVKAAQPLPPAPHPPAPRPSSPAPGASCPTYAGANADKQAEVKPALDAAAGMHFWTNSARSISVPTKLLYAEAWQESGWQSAIVACDGGVGTMQIMSNTADWMNNRFGTSYDFHTLDGNVMIGAEYLSWLIKYMGDVYFQGSYDLSVPAAAGSVSLLDSVISGYNYGPDAVDPTKGEAGIPNWQYVNNVEALMTNCPCPT